MEESRRFGEELGQAKKREQALMLKAEEYERTLSNRADDRLLRGRIGEL
jgi:chromosome segregation ATPase